MIVVKVVVFQSDFSFFFLFIPHFFWCGMKTGKEMCAWIVGEVNGGGSKRRISCDHLKIEIPIKNENRSKSKKKKRCQSRQYQ